MDGQRQDDQLEPTYNSSVPIQNVAMKTYQERWMTEKGSGRGSGRSMLAARHDCDDICRQETKSNNYKAGTTGIGGILNL